MTVPTPDAKTLSRKSGTSFYYSFALLAPEKRSALYSLYNIYETNISLSKTEKIWVALKTWLQQLCSPPHPLPCSRMIRVCKSSSWRYIPEGGYPGNSNPG